MNFVPFADSPTQSLRSKTLKYFPSSFPDNLHDYLRFSYPRMVAPSFFCQSETANGLLLRYRSRRRGFVPYVIGQIREVARLYYDTELTVEVLSDGRETFDDLEAGNSQDRKSHLTIRWPGVGWQLTRPQVVCFPMADG